MISVLDDPAIRARVHAISVADYHTMIERGAAPEKVELIRGTFVEKMSQSPLHASIVELLRESLAMQIAADFIVRQEKPLTLEDSEPEPDLAIVRGARSDFLNAHPTTAEIIIEVCGRSEAIDRLKLQLYAEAGVRECWLVLAEERVLERHTAPQGTAYRDIERVPFPGTLPSTVFPGLALPPPGLFPG